MKELISRFILLLVSVGLLIGAVFMLLKREDTTLPVNDNYNLGDMTGLIIMPDITTAPEQETDIQSIVVIEDNYPEGYTDVTDITDVSEQSETDATTVSRTIITSRVRKDYDKNSVYIDMKNILQQPELPVGCEITALTILLNYYGFNAEKTDMARNYLPKGNNYRTEDGKVYKDSFFDYFIGDPFTRGYGCFANAIEKAANRYISDNGGGYTVLNISGAHPDVLYDYLAQGIPVVCWATDGMIEPEYYETWYDYSTGEQLDWYINEHCFVLAGFNISGDTVTLNDPMKGIIDYNINKFETRYDQMHRQAIVILKDNPEPIDEPINAEYNEPEEENIDL